MEFSIFCLVLVVNLYRIMTASRGVSDEFFAVFFFHFRYKLFDFFGVFCGANQCRLGGVDDDEVLTVDEVVMR